MKVLERSPKPQAFTAQGRYPLIGESGFAVSKRESEPTLKSSGYLNLVLQLLSLAQGFGHYIPRRQREWWPWAVILYHSEPPGL